MLIWGISSTGHPRSQWMKSPSQCYCTPRGQDKCPCSEPSFNSHTDGDPYKWMSEQSGGKLCDVRCDHFWVGLRDLVWVDADMVPAYMTVT